MKPNQQLKSLKEKVERMKNEKEMREMEGIKYSDGFHKAVSDVLYLIENLIK
jgi:hypothetical protein